MLAFPICAQVTFSQPMYRVSHKKFTLNFFRFFLPWIFISTYSSVNLFWAAFALFVTALGRAGVAQHSCCFYYFSRTSLRPFTLRRWRSWALNCYKSSISAHNIAQTISFLSMFCGGVSLEGSWSSLLTSTWPLMWVLKPFVPSLILFIFAILSGLFNCAEMFRE